MSGSEALVTARPRLLALFHKRMDGDDALLKLAGRRFEEAGLGPEYYAETPGELGRLLGFRPENGAPATVHLPRTIDLLEEADRKTVVDFARCFHGKLYGLVVHDQREIIGRFDRYVSAVHELEASLIRVEGSPLLFLEYASGLEPELFVRLFKALESCTRVSACIDTGHLGLWRVREVFAGRHPGTDVCGIRPQDPRLPEIVEDVHLAVGAALQQVVDVIRELAPLGKPLHFHLHDGHPLGNLSPFGVSDHLSFLTRVPIPFEYRGKKSFGTMYGPAGLYRIVTETLGLLGPDLSSFSLEIHPTEGRLPLGDASSLFGHWMDKGNAERMNFWLSVLAQNHMLLSEICDGFEKHRKGAKDAKDRKGEPAPLR